MARIPDYTALNRAIPQVSGNIDTRGVGANIGEGLASLSQSVLAVQEEKYAIKQRNLVAKANADLSIDMVGEASALSADNDYDTQEERFSKFSEDKLGEYASTITDPNARNIFMQNARQKMAVAKERVRAGAWAKEKDVNRGAMLTTLDTLRNAAVESGEIDILHNDAKNVIAAATESRYIDSEESAKLYDKWRSDTTVSRIEYLPPEKRLSTLKQKWAKDNMDPEVRAGLMREAEEQNRIGIAQTQVDEYLANDINREDAMYDIDKKYSKNPELRKAVESRYDYAFNRKQMAKTEMQSSIFDEYFYPVRSGDLLVDDIPEKTMRAMSPAQINSLYSAQSTSVSGTKVGFNATHEDQLNIYYKRKDFIKVREYWMDNAGSMSDSQNKAWSKVSVEGLVPIEVKGLFSATQSLDAKIPGYGDKKKAELKEKLNIWYQDYQEKTNQIPDDKMVDDQIDRMVMEYDTNWLYGIGTKPIFQMTADEKKTVLRNAKKDDEKSFKDVEEYFKKAGIQPDEAQFMEAYTTLNESRNAQ